MDTRLRKTSEESTEMVKRMNDIVKEIKKADSSKIALTSAPYQNKERALSK